MIDDILRLVFSSGSAVAGESPGFGLVTLAFAVLVFFIRLYSGNYDKRYGRK